MNELDEIINETTHTDFNKKKKKLITKLILITVTFTVTVTLYCNYTVPLLLGWGLLPGGTLSRRVCGGILPSPTGLLITTHSTCVLTTITSVLPQCHGSHYLGREPGWWSYPLNHVHHQPCIRPPLRAANRAALNALL